MNVVIWLMVAATSSSNTSPALIARFETEAQCQSAADELWRRSIARNQMKSHYMSMIDAVCVPAQGVKQ
jgi:hypothetical protein